MSVSKQKKITAAELDEMFDRGDDISEYLDHSTLKKVYPTQRITIDFPTQILDALDLEAAKIGVTRTSLIKMWIAEHLSDR